MRYKVTVTRQIAYEYLIEASDEADAVDRAEKLMNRLTDPYRELRDETEVEDIEEFDEVNEEIERDEE